ncbi:conserved hypothetical protein [Tenacibaculum maritimum]|uniref:hypothetical protein n=1 Tax=Tenacibaculum maritimum TaxID=107401 RepID=UPI0012E61DC3|nr:hypothetical protein [Tenacibaculum maritimum]MCD9582307.1 hypothetical protein [Tenacibaculum maritimum]MCD9636689.1 hypothetical protein [Tenacibaculum maritimum]CAA0144800.1 conserved hypothetical protein [Tenacibaculum maritimum]CAA0192770.1 conserved hypothetical protein [Tenacibaculum maritimum]
MDKIKVEIQNYTLNCLCNLHDVVIEEASLYPAEIETTKEYKAVLGLVDKVIIKLKKKLLDKRSASTFSFGLEYYQAYYLVQFLFANIQRIRGITEQTILFNLAMKIDQEL